MENTITIDSVLALIHEMARESKEAIQETREQLEERARRSEEEIQEIRALFKETDVQLEERTRRSKEEIQEIRDMFKETDKQMKAAGKRISELGGRLGEIIEHIVSPHLEEKFKQQFGITLDTVIVEHTIEEPGRGIIAEVDVFLSDGEYAVAVEAKSKPNIRDIDEHVERMKKLRGYADRRNDPRKYLGAIAGMVVPAQVKEYAFKQGFPVLLPSGDSIALECPEGFSPRMW